MFPKSYEIVDDTDFQVLVSLNACAEYQKRFEAFLTGLPLDERLKNGLKDLAAFEKDGKTEFDKVLKLLDR